MPSATSESEAYERRTLVFGVAYTVIVSLFVAPLFGVFALISLVVGAALALANFWLLARTVAALLQNRAFLGWAVAVALKLFLLGLALFALFRAGWVSALPFVLGLGAVPTGIALAQLFALRSSAST